MPDGNILVVEKNGIFLCDSIMTNILRNEVNFTNETDKINSVADLSKVILKRQLGYIFCLVNYKLYMFDLEGKNLFISKSKLITTSSPEYCTLCPLGFSNDLLYYAIGYFDNNIYLNLLLYKYDISNNKYNILVSSMKYRDFRIIGNYGSYESYRFQNNGLSCEFMKEYIYGTRSVFVCFFVILSGRNKFLIGGYYWYKY